MPEEHALPVAHPDDEIHAAVEVSIAEVEAAAVSHIAGDGADVDFVSSSVAELRLSSRSRPDADVKATTAL